MRRHALGFCLLAITSLCLVADGADDKTKKEKPAPAPKYYRDETWSPKAGDKAHVFLGPKMRAFVGIDFEAYTQVERAFEAQDSFGLDQLVKEGLAVEVQSLTPVLVLSTKNVDRKVAGRTFVGQGEAYALEVRLLEGNDRNKAGWIIAYKVSRLIEEKPAPAPKRKKK